MSASQCLPAARHAPLAAFCIDQLRPGAYGEASWEKLRVINLCDKELEVHCMGPLAPSFATPRAPEMRFKKVKRHSTQDRWPT